jgi:hypothetical protein
MSNHKWQIGPVKLVNGLDASIYRYCENRKRYIGEWTGRCGGTYATEWLEGGSNTCNGIGDPMLDLAPPPKKTVRVQLWINVYADGHHAIHASSESALAGGEHARFACIEFDRVVEEGEGL